jgi:predicted ATP-binding protein involved in virulence
MVTIKKIEIKDYFGRGNFEWNLDPVVNILGGKNGSGKSSLFKLCYSLLANEKMGKSLVEELKKIFKEAVLTLSNGWTITWQPEMVTNFVVLNLDGQKPEMLRSVSVIKDERGQKKQFSDLQNLIQAYMINSFEQHLDKAIQYWQQPKSISLNNPTMLDLMIYDQINLRNLKFSSAMENYIESSEIADQKRREYASIYTKTYSVLEHFLKEYDKPFKSSFEFSKNGNKFGYEHLSMGEKQILLLLLMVGNVNQEACVFFMDEPDLSMHIDWKEILVKELHELNPNMQIILSTHAPSVITGWKDRVEEVSHLIK